MLHSFLIFGNGSRQRLVDFLTFVIDSSNFLTRSVSEWTVFPHLRFGFQ